MNKVLVIGDSCLDEYIYCTASRFCPDAPVPILKPESFVSTLGMAGNVVDNLEALGIEVELISNANKIKKTRYVVEAKNIILDFNNKNSASSDQHPQVKQQRSPEKLCVLLS